jgi:hypothetical protein
VLGGALSGRSGAVEGGMFELIEMNEIIEYFWTKILLFYTIFYTNDE